MTPTQFAAAIKKLGLSPQELANVTGVNRSTIWRYLNGKTKVNKFFAKEIKNMLQRASM